MVHSGYEASSVEETFGSIKGLLAMARATLRGNPSAAATPTRSSARLGHHAAHAPGQLIELTIHAGNPSPPQNGPAQ